MLRKTFAAAVLAFVLPLLPACGTGGDVAEVRLVNASPDFATLDLYAGGDLAVSGVPVNQASAYAKVDTGTKLLDVHSGGTGTSAVSTTQTLSVDKHYSLIVYENGGTAPSQQFISDDEPAPTGDNAKFRVLNAASSQVASVDVYLTTNACGSLQPNDVAVASAVTTLQDAFVEVAAATGAGKLYNVCATSTGNKQDVRLSVPSVAFIDGQVNTLVLTTTTGGVLLNGLMVVQQGSVNAFVNTSARMRLVADAALGAPVTAVANGTTLASAPTSPNIGTTYQTVTSGTLTLVATIGGTTIAVPTPTITPGLDYTLMITGTAADPGVFLIPDDNTLSTDENNPVKIRLVNGVNGVGAPLSLSLDGSTIIGGVTFGTASTPVVTPATDGSSIEVDADTAVIWTAAGTVTLSENRVYTVWALGDAGNTQLHTYLKPDR